MLDQSNSQLWFIATETDKSSKKCFVPGDVVFTLGLGLEGTELSFLFTGRHSLKQLNRYKE